MKTLQPLRARLHSPVARTGNYEDYQSYVEDQTQYNKEVRCMKRRLPIRE